MHISNQTTTQEYFYELPSLCLLIFFPQCLMVLSTWDDTIWVVWHVGDGGVRVVEKI